MSTSTPPAGRYAPSPSGDLHIGNLRTAVIAWLRAAGRLALRIDDIDAQRTSPHFTSRQRADLEELGLRFVGPAARQQETYEHYESALQDLQRRGLVYECFCSRRDIQDAVRAPHAIPGRYPGTCRDLSVEEAGRKREELAAGGSRGGRVPALRLRAGVSSWEVTELFAAEADPLTRVYAGDVDDMVLRRGGNILPRCAPGEPGDDGAGGHARDYAYNLAVVVDDALAHVREVVRGDDLLSSAPRQAYLAHLLDLPEVQYVHVPLVVGPEGRRLAKRDGAVTLAQLRAVDPGASARVLEWILGSLGGAAAASSSAAGGAAAEAVASAESLADRNHRVLLEALESFDLGKLPRDPVSFDPDHFISP
ncbi:tRNA glutamyl-Q(34) synthetase GluQRS [Corynebacterium sp. 320]|uniref:glutamate--tRNA ligase family protein n=1 Tax=Corynebacterium TaxID=1716 RepID=UPI00125CCE67|nr:MULTISPECIES: glutamate--tRNA ligase family protein [Corynebacterium]KAB1502839.1 tRNA glutamyl-Q(34) synthetase GluQRS [Corynebacterium sp. 320]KAB1552350.1 tRNA glutamyl-Q(34) synthetase GluQRS [Corynebacterium sp. 321]KAB1554435.1 tRNA glutamyl-Q(34) synthetase GluQRS [Corynebacterium sp. 319]KAB3526502.1 tRNA glutamyl-Q(34) synthetase GluQRS [Corynebacterium sp. 250]KAB3539822.1 tRNA glutamyl-Q(34) synthetase GluQRS [Corynebacterium sp. 366]